MRSWMVVAVIVCGGCFKPSFVDGKTPCTKDSECPPNFHCAVDKRCWGANRNPVDMAEAPAPDMAVEPPDLYGFDGIPPDLTPPADLSPIVYPPAAVWTSCGGGSGAATSGTQLNMSVGGTAVMGTSDATSGARATFGYFSNQAY